MSEYNYPPPVDKLLTYSDCRKLPKWPDYLALGLGPEHIPDLTRMATDDALHYADSDSRLIWAPVHAWRALGQLHATEAIEPLLGLLHKIDDDDDDMINEELPQVYGMIGPAAIPALKAYLASSSYPLFARIAAAEGLKQIASEHPDARDQCVAVLTNQLELFAENDLTLNAFLVSPLLDLKAVESLPVMERAFAANRVDTSIVGDWEDVQIEFDLKATRDKPRQIPPEIEQPRQMLEAFMARSRSSEKFASPLSRKTKAKKRDKKQPGQRLRGKKRKS